MKHLIAPAKILAIMANHSGIPAPAIRVLLALYYTRRTLTTGQISEELGHALDTGKSSSIPARAVAYLRKHHYVTDIGPIVLTGKGQRAIVTLQEAYTFVQKTTDLI